MNRILAIAQAVVADAIRRKVVWIVVVFAALLATVIPTLPSYGVGVVQGVFREVSIALMFSASAVLAIALAATRVPGEVERRTVFSVLARDVSRWHYLAGTWLGISTVVGVAVLAFTLVTIVIGVIVYSTLMWVLLGASFAVWLEMSVLVAFTIALSTIVGAVTAAVGGGGFLFIFHAIGAALYGEDPRPWWLPSLDVFNVINPVAHGSGYSIGYAVAMAATAVAWIVLLLIAGSALFESKDL
jgi:ABC-type transport system involved in multi-copper enzyme maturation permease subunit